MENSYTGFARVYDKMQYDVDYALWIEAVDDRVKRYVPTGRTVLELACGTGTVAIGLSEKGYVTEGCDVSDDMLAVAFEKAKRLNQRVRFTRQDMRELRLNKRFDAVVCLCDGLNYITEDGDLGTVFQNVAEHLSPAGLFVFDLSTVYKLENIIGDATFAETFEDSAYIWENQYDKARGELAFWLTLFIKSGTLYERFEEHHLQRAYTIDAVKAALPQVFEVLEILDGDTFEALGETAQRMCFVVRKRKDR